MQTIRRKYLFKDRAEAEEEYRKAAETSQRREIMLGTPPTMEHHKGRIMVRIWIRPRSGWAWYTIHQGQTMVADGEDLIRYSEEWNRRNRDTEDGRVFGDAILEAAMIARKLLER